MKENKERIRQGCGKGSYCGRRCLVIFDLATKGVLLVLQVLDIIFFEYQKSRDLTDRNHTNSSRRLRATGITSHGFLCCRRLIALIYKGGELETV